MRERVGAVPAGRLATAMVAAALVGTCGATSGRSGSGVTPTDRLAANATLVRVVDGDTVRARLGGREERVRLIGINTPETHGKGGLRECFGEEATHETERLLPRGTSVRLVRDVEARDRYGRLLAYVYRARDGVFVNLELARRGYAEAYTFPPNLAHVEEFVAAARNARERDLGLWRKCGGPHLALN